ncbi:adenylate cyclase type 10 [Ascaphus truei]|uniref:adenylate cyclase type 10 n=1 Tax=Ascaphus truei TaxID=8439 RepID=UPI003F5A6048
MEESTFTQKNPHKIGKVAAHVPDLVVYGNLQERLPYTQNFHGVLLFADVSGFTALTEKFSISGKKECGADMLTRTLNKYIGDIVHYVLVAGGDILNFAGDALLALWKVERYQLSEVITLVVQCSMEIQEKCGVRETEVGVDLRVKIAIAAGRISQIVVGSREQEYFVVIGRAVDEVRLAERLAEPSSIILSPNAWELCDRNTIATEKIPNERAVRLRFIKKKTDFDLEEYIEHYGKHLQHEPEAHETCRKVSHLSPNPNLEKTLRKYVMDTVLEKVDDDQPLEYLSEMRSVTILFLNLQFEESVLIEEQCQAMQDTSKGIARLIRSGQGRINKIYMFDKGCTFLCVFGLPGDKMEDECAVTLRSAFKIHLLCSERIETVRITSIGVTSGPVFCGVVGHPLRHEYTVIGRKVNLAARMMMHYPGLVSCDQETFCDSKLPAYFFDELPPQEMKGFKSPGTIYQYLGSKEKTTVGKAHMTTERDENYPLLGREKEMAVFSSTLHRFLQCKRSHWEECRRIIVYEGAVGYGKSRILAEIKFLAQTEGYRVIDMELNKMNIRHPFYTIQTLMAIFLRLDVCKGYAEREKVLQTKISRSTNSQSLCLLNNLFLVKFPISDEVSLMEPDTKRREMEMLLLRLLQQAAEKDVLVCIIDQAHYIDTASWNFLSEITASVPIFMAMALCPLRPGKLLSYPAAHILRSPHTVFSQLEELHRSVIPEIACNSLGVISIGTDLEKLLVERSYGVPYYLDELLKSLYVNNMLELRPVEEEERDQVDELFIRSLNLNPSIKSDETSKSFVKWQLMNPRKVMSLMASRPEGHELFTCSLSEAVKLQNIPLPYTLRGIALAQLDHMTAAEQMVVKCAAVIGQTFSTVLLMHILPKGSEWKLSQTLRSLVKANMLECALRAKKQDESTVTQKDTTKRQLCYCPADTPKEGEKGWTPHLALGPPLDMWSCRVMRFCTPLLQETAYGLWLCEQSRNLHLQCASFLESHAHRCSKCGGGDFIFGHQLALITGDSYTEIGFSETSLNSRDQDDKISAEAAQLTETVLKGLAENNMDVPEDPNYVIEHFKCEDNLSPPDKPLPHTGDLCVLVVADAETPMEASTDSRPAAQQPLCDKPGDIFAAPLPLCDEEGDAPAGQQSMSNQRGKVPFRARISILHRVTPVSEKPRMEQEFLERLDCLVQKGGGGSLSHIPPGDCCCAEILESVVSALARHWMRARDPAKSVYYLLETAAAALYLFNNYMALSYLNEAETVLQSLKSKKRNETFEMENEKVKISRFETACLYGMKGEVLFNMGQVVASERLLRRSLALLGRPFPSTLAGAAVRLVLERARNNLNRRESSQGQPVYPTQYLRLPFIYEQIQRLSLLWQIYSACGGVGGRVRAFLAAMMEVNSAEVCNNQSKVILAYADCFQCCQIVRRRHDCERFAVLAMQCSAHLSPSLEALTCTLHLSLALTRFNLCFGHLSDAIEFGIRTHSLAVLLNKTSLEYRIIPLLFKSLFLSNRYNEFVSAARRLETLTDTNQAVIFKAWFYILCLDILLEGGFALRPLDDCLAFVGTFHSNSALATENQIMLNLLSSLALWFGRLQEWGLFHPFFRKAKKLLSQTNASFFALCGFSKFLECQVLLLRKAMEEHSVDSGEINKKTAQFMEKFKSCCITAPVFLARLYHLKAFMLLLSGKRQKAKMSLQQGLMSAREHENRLEECWITMSNECWFEESTCSSDQWLELAVDMPLWEDVAGTDLQILFRRKYVLRPLPADGEDQQELAAASLLTTEINT